MKPSKPGNLGNTTETIAGAGGMGEVYLAEHQLMKRPWRSS